MAKEVNLSSQEWCDLVFEGKNKDFGAYVIRTESSKRHNKAVLWTLIGAIIFGLVAFAYLKADQYLEERKLAEKIEQEKVLVDMTPQNEEAGPEREILEQEKPEVIEDVLNSVKVTELQIVEDDQVREEDEILSQDEIQETSKAFGQTNVDNGQDDRAKFQTAVDEIVVEEPVEKPKEVKEEILTLVEQMPQFPGGDAALMKFLSSHINYPPMAAENNVQGKVILQFVVEKDGHVGEVKIARAVDKDLDREAVRVVKSLPKFIPGRQNGHPVRVWYTLPVNFKLQGTN